MTIDAREVALERLAGYLDELPLYPTGRFIGKAMYSGYNLELSFRETHAQVRRHFRKHGIRHRVWWTERTARECWEFAKKVTEENRQ